VNKLKPGVHLESFKLPLRRALQEAQRLAITGVQVDALGDLSPRNLSQTGRREFLHLLRAHSLELTALGCPLRSGLDRAEGQEARIDHVKKVLQLGFDLGPRVVIVPCAKLPEDPNDPLSARLREALLALGQHGDRTGTVLALQTGPDAGDTVRQFLSRFDTGGLAVNLSPGNLLLHGFDPRESARALPGKVVHVHASDARRSSLSRTAQEVPLGHGDIDWMQMLGVLEEIEYRGWLTISQETGDNRIADLTASVAFLRRLGV